MSRTSRLSFSRLRLSSPRDRRSRREDGRPGQPDTNLAMLRPEGRRHPGVWRRSAEVREPLPRFTFSSSVKEGNRGRSRTGHDSCVTGPGPVTVPAPACRTLPLPRSGASGGGSGLCAEGGDRTVKNFERDG